jgi:rRNA maturation endonuclease Nob1
MVGKRERVHKALKMAIKLLEIFTVNGPKPSAIEYDETCAGCKAPVKITLSEDINTGEIWLEGPDKCEKCGHQLSDDRARAQPLSQEAIANLFGRY